MPITHPGHRRTTWRSVQQPVPDFSKPQVGLLRLAAVKKTTTTGIVHPGLPAGAETETPDPAAPLNREAKEMPAIPLIHNVYPHVAAPLPDGTPAGEKADKRLIVEAALLRTPIGIRMDSATRFTGAYKPEPGQVTLVSASPSSTTWIVSEPEAQRI